MHGIPDKGRVFVQEGFAPADGQMDGPSQGQLHLNLQQTFVTVKWFSAFTVYLFSIKRLKPPASAGQLQLRK
jgi:hypothetical protein